MSRDGLSELPPPPDGRPLVTVRDYADAVRAVDVLADARFPIEYVAIVCHGVVNRYDVTLTGGERAGALRILHGAGLA